MILRCAGVCQHPSTFWSVTLQSLGADQATIQKMKEDFLSFHMRHETLICCNRLHTYSINPVRNIHALVFLINESQPSRIYS